MDLKLLLLLLLLWVGLLLGSFFFFFDPDSFLLDIVIDSFCALHCIVHLKKKKH